MLKKISIVLGIIASVLILAVTVGFSYAWYLGIEKDEINLSGASAGAYFYDGDGSEANPFKIADSRHMYNLVWLQNNGKLDQKYYFELWNPNDANGRNGFIDMSSTIIPPIGNDENPFIGVFNGNGNKITNLVVSTNYDVIKNGNVLSEKEYKFSNAVGLFGMTGSGSVVKNFILDNPVVEVCDTDENYATTGQKVAGLAIGYVENNAASIGVIGGTLANRRDDSYSTYNSILGGMSSTAQSNMNITGNMGSATGDKDKGYFIPDIIYSKAKEQKINGVTPNYTRNVVTTENATGNVLEFNLSGNPVKLTKSDDTLGLGAFSLITDTADTNIRSVAYNANTVRFYASANTDIDSCQNVDGLAAVNNTAIYSEASSEKYDIDITQNDGYYTSQLSASATAAEKEAAAKKDSILANVKFVNQRIYSFDYCLYFNKSLNASSSAVDVYYEDGQTPMTTQSSDRNAIITFEITKASVEEPAQVFLIAGGNSASNTRSFGIYREEDYTGSVAYKKKYPKQILDLPAGYNVTGCYFNITEKGTYFLGSTGSSMRLYFLSVLGLSEGQESTGSYSDEYMISGIDFITDTTSIKQTAGLGQFDFVSSSGTYSYTKVKISYTSNMNGVVLYFKRENDTIASLLLLINPNTNGVNKTGSGTCTLEATNVALVITSTGVTSPSPFN